jgi:hypothetical protein
LNKDVITAIIDAPEAECWSLMVAFIGVIEDYIEDYLDARLPSRGDPVSYRLSLAVSAVSSFVPV